ncbi:hypothetical protein LJC20_07070 [Eubacteriales bacterium OttesenSCG-928-M02]|nr:hypothetical protein [Eubacteriales bacterium OttesenSCG-928-M02]
MTYQMTEIQQFTAGGGGSKAVQKFLGYVLGTAGIVLACYLTGGGALVYIKIATTVVGGATAESSISATVQLNHALSNGATVDQANAIAQGVFVDTFSENYMKYGMTAAGGAVAKRVGNNLAGFGNSGAGNSGAKVKEVSNQAVEWLGDDSRVITNKSGDKVFVSADGTRKVRFDLNNPGPYHQSPHGHVEELINGSWNKSGQVYPWDVPHY